VLGAGWSAAGLGTIAVVSAAEAVTFTAINVALFEKDPTVLGTLAQLGENFLMFGAMRGISVGYGKFVGEAFAKSPAGKLLGGVVQLETAALTALLTKYVHAKAEGRELTQAEARHAVLETLAFTVGMAVAARCFEPFMKSLQLRGAAAYRSMFGEVDAMRVATARRGQALAASAKEGDIAKVLEADAATMAKENALLERIRTRSADPKTPAGERLTAAELAQVNAAGEAGAQAYAGNRRAVALNGLQPTSGNSFVVGPGELEPRVKLLTDEKVGFKERSRVVDPLTGRPSVELVSGTETIRLTEVAGSAGTVVAKPTPTPTMTGCFVAGTPVHTPLGLHAIDTLRAGEPVHAVDPQTGAVERAVVITAYTRTTPELRVLRIGEHELRCSPEHPFLVADRGWVPAGELIMGEELVMISGGARSLESISSEPGPVTVHNIEVDGPHTYAVGPHGLVVHNKAAELRTMSPELAARFNRLRAAGADPRALTQFESMFRNLDGDSALMIEALDRMSARGDPVKVLIKQYEARMARIDARLKAEADQFQQRQGELAKYKETALKKLVGDPASPKDPAALAELTRRFEQRSKLDLVQMMRRDSKFNGPIAASVLARGKGVPVSEAGYADFMANGGSIEVLRDAALVDRAALHELITQYRQLPPPELERLRAAGDSIADQVSSEPDRGPRMQADADERMTEAIWERRRTAIEQAEARLAAAVGPRPTRAAERAVAAATHDGTIGAMETDIPGVTELTVRGSPEAPQGADPGPEPNRQYQPPEPHDPAKPLPESAHHHAEDRFVNHLAAEFRRLGITQRQLIGRTVRISVDQAVCQTCAAGVAGSRNGVLLQFSADHPGLRIEVADINTGSLSVFERGVRTGHYERVPTYAEP
jgi:Pretoxin HINT domain